MEGIALKRKIAAVIAAFCLCLTTTGCGEDPELTEFKTNFENFCINVSALDTSINQIDAQSDTASEELLDCIDRLNEQFQILAGFDFPEEFDYLEELSDQAGEYMAVAASSYHEAYADGSFDQYMSDYAYANYKRAYKRVQIILIYLHGEEPQDEDLMD